MIHDTEVEDWNNELCMLASFVGTDAKNPEKKLLAFVHHQLQKARHDWLREEIVRLEGMLNRWVAAYMPADEGKDPSKWGFSIEKEAWDFIEERVTPCPLYPKDKSGKPCDSCMAEWMVYQIPEVDQALQTIIDRYQSELDHPTSPVYDFFTAPEEVQRPVIEEAIKKASEEQADL